ncbi:hypothetical protein DFH09DRAFT_1332199 [Mycena vulgaris]|nr:hypothetical protein DFH09DRAFT_1332199 [Mycena vulgaris]
MVSPRILNPLYPPVGSPLPHSPSSNAYSKVCCLVHNVRDSPSLHTHRVAGSTLLFLRAATALTFGTIERRIAVGNSTVVTWTNDSTDPPFWMLSVANWNGNTAATIQTVNGSAGRSEFVFPTVESNFRPVFTFQATSGDELLATSEPFFAAAAEQRGGPSSSSVTSSSSPAAISIPTGAIDSITKTNSTPTPSASSQSSLTLKFPTATASSSPSVDEASPGSSQINLPALIAGPILLVGTICIVGFILFTAGYASRTQLGGMRTALYRVHSHGPAYSHGSCEERYEFRAARAPHSVSAVQSQLLLLAGALRGGARLAPRAGHDGLTHCEMNREVRGDIMFDDIMAKALEWSDSRPMAPWIRAVSNNLTLAMTIIYALERLKDDDSWTRKHTLTIHILSAAQKEIESAMVFEEILHRLPEVKTLKLVIWGSEQPGGRVPKIIAMETYSGSCTERGRKLIHEHVADQGTKFEKPDLCIVFNSGASQQSMQPWAATFKVLVERKLPSIFTVYNREEAEGEAALLRAAGAQLISGLGPVENPSILGRADPDPEENTPPSDLILRAGDGVDLHVHKVILAFVSVFFKDLFHDGSNFADVYRLLSIAYPARSLKHSSLADNLDGVYAVHEAAQKYLFTSTKDLLERLLEEPDVLNAQPHRGFAIARLRDLPELARNAALSTLNSTMSPVPLVFPELEVLPAAAFQSPTTFTIGVVEQRS